jgi:hypothetical protein
MTFFRPPERGSKKPACRNRRDLGPAISDPPVSHPSPSLAGMNASGAGPADAELDGIRRRFDSVLARMQREERPNERKARRDRFQRDMGIGYLL